MSINLPKTRQPSLADPDEKAFSCTTWSAGRLRVEMRINLNLRGAGAAGIIVCSCDDFRQEDVILNGPKNQPVGNDVILLVKGLICEIQGLLVSGVYGLFTN